MLSRPGLYPHSHKRTPTSLCPLLLLEAHPENTEPKGWEDSPISPPTNPHGQSKSASEYPPLHFSFPVPTQGRALSPCVQASCSLRPGFPACSVDWCGGNAGTGQGGMNQKYSRPSRSLSSGGRFHRRGHMRQKHKHRGFGAGQALGSLGEVEAWASTDLRKDCIRPRP